MVCVEASHPKACLLPDVYHIFKGGSDFGGLALLDDNAIQVFHMNDYPAEPAREQMKDAHRVYPGDGVAPPDGDPHRVTAASILRLPGRLAIRRRHTIPRIVFPRHPDEFRSL